MAQQVQPVPLPLAQPLLEQAQRARRVARQVQAEP
jgi:hypothetical protein